MEKKFFSYEQQLHFLQEEKELTIPDLDYAHEMLRRYGYYSLIGGYKDKFKDQDGYKYRSDVCFNDIVALYEFDEELRGLFLKYIQKIEKQLKSQIAYYFCEKYGEKQEAYLLSSNYNSVEKNKKNVEKLIGILKNYTNGRTNYDYINHAIDEHNNLPLWVLINALTMGNVSKFYSLLQYDVQTKISLNYIGINENQLAKLLNNLTIFRNICAHGERLYCCRIKQSIPTLSLHRKLGIPQIGHEYKYGKHDLFAAVLAMRYLLPNDVFLRFKAELTRLIDKYLKHTTCFLEYDVLEFMGFPTNWKKVTLYRKI